MNNKIKLEVLGVIVLFVFMITNTPLVNNSSSVTNNQNSVTGTVKIGVLVPLTGSLSSYSSGFLDGIKSAALAINQSTNFTFSIQLMIEDTGTNSITTGSAYNTLKANGVQLILGPASSADAEAIVKNSSTDQIPLISYSATAPLLSNTSYDYFFRIIPSDVLQMKSLSLLLNHFTHKNIAVVFQNDSYGSSLENELNSSFTNLGGVISSQFNFSIGTTDFSSIITSINGLSTIDGLVFIGFHNAGDSFITQLRQSNNNLPLYTSTDGVLSSNSYSKNVMGVDITGGQPGEFNYDTFVNDLKTCNSQYICSGVNVPQTYSDFAYDSMMVGALAINMSSTYNGLSIKNNLPLAGMNYIGATGNKSFTSTGDPVFGQTSIWQIQNNEVITIGNYTDQTGLQLNNLFVRQYKPHGTISITSNNQFSTNDFSGSGTMLDPYLFEGYNITTSGSYLINVQNTNNYFEIKNCFLNGLNTTYAGIQLTNVQNGFLGENVIKNNSEDGIRLASQVNLVTIYGNTIQDNGWNGIFVKYSININVTENFVEKQNYVGIRFEYSNQSIITKNTVLHSGENGFYSYFSEYNLFSENSAFDNTADGFFVLNSNHIDVAKNNAFNNLQNGIITQQSNNDNIIGNTIYGNSGFGAIGTYSSIQENLTSNNVYSNYGNGIYLENTNKSILKLNEIDGNSYAGIRLASSSSGNNISYNVLYNPGERDLWIETGSQHNNVSRNDFLGEEIANKYSIDDGSANSYSNNYWSDWSGTGSKSLSGTGNSKDANPVLNPNHIQGPQFILPVTKNNNKLTLTWTAYSDSFNHSLTLNLYYSIDGGLVWNSIANNLKVSQYTWDFTNIDTKNGLLVKIQVEDSVRFKSSDIYVVVKTPTSTTTATTTSQNKTNTFRIPTSGIEPIYPLLALISCAILLNLSRKKRKL